jgi:hypothetical protein
MASGSKLQESGPISNFCWTKANRELIIEKYRGFYAKRLGLTASGRLTSHAARRGWRVHGSRCGPRRGGALDHGPRWTGSGAAGCARRRGGLQRRRHGRGAPARCGGATGHGERRRGHRRVARAEASAVRVLATRERGRGGRAARRAARRRSCSTTSETSMDETFRLANEVGKVGLWQEVSR